MMIQHYEAPRSTERIPFRGLITFFAMGTVINFKAFLVFVAMVPFSAMAPMSLSTPFYNGPHSMFPPQTAKWTNWPD